MSWCQVGRKVCGESVVTKCPGVKKVVKSAECRLSPSVMVSGRSNVCGESVVTKCPAVR